MLSHLVQTNEMLSKWPSIMACCRKELPSRSCRRGFGISNVKRGVHGRQAMWVGVPRWPGAPPGAAGDVGRRGLAFTCMPPPDYRHMAAQACRRQAGLCRHGCWQRGAHPRRQTHLGGLVVDGARDIWARQARGRKGHTQERRRGRVRAGASRMAWAAVAPRGRAGAHVHHLPGPWLYLAVQYPACAHKTMDPHGWSVPWLPPLPPLPVVVHPWFGTNHKDRPSTQDALPPRHVRCAPMPPPPPSAAARPRPPHTRADPQLVAALHVRLGHGPAGKVGVAHARQVDQDRAALQNAPAAGRRPGPAAGRQGGSAAQGRGQRLLEALGLAQQQPGPAAGIIRAQHRYKVHSSRRHGA